MTATAAADDPRRAVEAILRRAGAPNPAALAGEVHLAYLGRSWRHVPALDPAPDTGPPTPAHRVPAAAAAARAALRAATRPDRGDPT